MILGSHVSLAGEEQFLGSVKEALSYKANALMVYTGAPQNTARKDLSEMRIEEAHDLLRTHEIPFSNIVVHAPYIVNLANPDPQKQQFAQQFLIQEILRTEALGARYMVLHPGAHLGDGPQEGIRRIASGLQIILDETKNSPVMVLLETMAGKGSEVGRTFEELKEIISQTDRPNRVGICFDTCHTSDANYPITTDFESVLAQFHQVIGLDLLKVLHINDTKNPQGAQKDRHENFGFGQIGFESLMKVIQHPQLSNVIKILETPYVKDPENEKKSYPPYAYEIEMIQQGVFNPNLLEMIINNRGNL